MSVRLLAALVVLTASCRPLPPARSPEGPSDREASGSSDATEADRVRAIADSIRLAMQDSVGTLVHDSLEAMARRDSLAAATRRDSIAAAARDSIAAGARRDSIAAAARQDSILQAARDSMAAAARRDSLAAAARRDSIAAAAAEAIRRDSIALAIAAARRDSVARELAMRDSVEAALGRSLSDSIAAARLRPGTADLEQLRALGPAYVPYDQGPQPVWDTETQAMLTTTLLPVVRAEDLSARTRAYYWMLVDEEGRVAELVLQTSSGSEAFDRAAAEVARQLRFSPAIRGGRAVPAWVVRDISLIMQ